MKKAQHPGKMRKLEDVRMRIDMGFMAAHVGIPVTICLLWFSIAASALIDAQNLQAITRVVQDLELDDKWAANADPCSTWNGTTTIGCDLTGTYIVNITLNSRKLTGIVSPALANLTQLALLDLSNNNLRGGIPDFFGNLSRLVKLNLGLNNLTGPIPEGIGGLGASLQFLYLDNNQLSGQIPASIANLTHLVELHLYSNQLDGEIPAGLGGLSQIYDLQLQSNKLSGGIPATLAGLSQLTTVKLGNNQLSGPLNLTVLEAWGTTLRYLYLQRNNFSGNIPAMDGTRFVKLEKLNLGFNQFNGTLPPSIGSMSTITAFFVGHNLLEGSIPGSYTNLMGMEYMDISHNGLSGSLDDTLTGIGLNNQNRQFDFTFNNLDVGGAPSNLVQQNNTLFNCPGSGPSPCVRYSPGSNKGFAVNVGGAFNVTNDDQQFFEGDPTLLSTFYTGTQLEPATGNWAMQTSGESGGTFTSSSLISNSNGSVQLYQSMRWSSEYLAYIGRNMRTGTFHVQLHFAELNFPTPGYRVFDVVVQGQMVYASLDVVAVVGPKTAYVLDLKEVRVDDGLLRIELIHVSPGQRWLDPDNFKANGTGPMLSAFSINFNGSDSGSPKTAKRKRSFNLLFLLPVLGAALALGLLFGCFRRRGEILRAIRAARRYYGIRTQPQQKFSNGLDIGPTFYSYHELFVASDGFSDKNLLGRGGFGSVHKGVLPDGSVVAIKQLTQKSEQRNKIFRKEVAIISSVQHRNLLAVIGCCFDSDFPLLVCEYMPNGSLESLLHGNDSPYLEWPSRRNIAIGAACGLAYLHDESKDRIIHCDVKPANILLDQNFNPRIADFGLARLYRDDCSHITMTGVRGTWGYIAPEYALRHHLSDKADVYSFGVVLLELLSGRRPVHIDLVPEQMVLVDWARQLGEEGILQLVDERLMAEFTEGKQVLEMATIALLCTQDAPNLRPSMRQVWLMLTGTIEIPNVPTMRLSKASSK